MHSTTRAIGKICTIGALILGGLLFAASAGAGDRHRGGRSNDHLDILSIMAAFHSDAILAYALYRAGDHIEYRYSRHHDHEARDWRGTHRRTHRHFDGCGHYELRHRVNHHNRFQHRRHHARKHRRHH